jgi:hypothetical protein
MKHKDTVKIRIPKKLQGIFGDRIHLVREGGRRYLTIKDQLGTSRCAIHFNEEEIIALIKLLNKASIRKAI